MDEVSKGLPFVVAQGKNMNKLRKDLKITKQHKIYNDKLYGSKPNRDNPYTAFFKSKQIKINQINGILLTCGS